MKVRYKVGAAGPDKSALNPGDETEVSADVGKELVEKGIAEPVGQKRAPKRPSKKRRDRAEKRPSKKPAESR